MGKKKKQTNITVANCNLPNGRKQPEIIVFEEPGISVQGGLKVEPQSRGKVSKSTEDPENLSDIDFTRLAREVRDYGSTGLRKGERKKYEQEKLRKLGAQKRKCKVPYPVGLERLRQRKEKEEKEKEREKAMGIIRKKAREENQKRRKLKRTFGRWIDKAPDIEKHRFNVNKIRISKVK